MGAGFFAFDPASQKRFGVSVRLMKDQRALISSLK
jgi:hypothetical protein